MVGRSLAVSFPWASLLGFCRNSVSAASKASDDDDSRRRRAGSERPVTSAASNGYRRAAPRLIFDKYMFTKLIYLHLLV